MTEPYLKLCPFCGSEAEHPEAMIEDCVTCSNPDCPVWSFPFTKEQWNATRPLEQQLLEACKKAYAILVIKYGSVSSPVGSLIGQLYAAIAAAEGSDQ